VWKIPPRFDALKKALAERMLNAEMDHHLTQEAAERIAQIIAMAIRKRRRSRPTVAATRPLAQRATITSAISRGWV
jgi:transposase-like protein